MTSQIAVPNPGLMTFLYDTDERIGTKLLTTQEFTDLTGLYGSILLTLVHPLWDDGDYGIELCYSLKDKSARIYGRVGATRETCRKMNPSGNPIYNLPDILGLFWIRSGMLQIGPVWGSVDFDGYSPLDLADPDAAIIFADVIRSWRAGNVPWHA